MKRRLLTSLAVAGCVVGSAAASGPPDIAHSYLFSPAGKFTPLHTGVTYQATQFPLPLRVTPPGAGWGGAQWKQNQFPPSEIQLRHLTCASNPKVCAPPYYGWVTIGRPSASPNSAPRALIVILSSFSRTPSVATVAARLCRGRLAGCGPTSPATLAGFPGVQVGGQTRGALTHFLIPFTPPSNAAAGDGAGDLIQVDGAHPFRVTVVNVRGKTVVAFIGSLVLSPDEFAAFLPEADRLLGSLRFPQRG